MIPSHFPDSPVHIWQYFHQINLLPRPSKHEDRMREFILIRSKALNLETFVDHVGNVIVYVPGRGVKKNSDPVIIQNHMDMVTDATPDRVINFKTDPIITFREGEWLKADRTTLGADNGIGCAAALALMEENSIDHPPLELLFTIDEETGLKGAWGVDATKLRGTRMLNLDTEEWGSLYIGCAGGIDYDFKKTFETYPRKEKQFKKIRVGGFLGGHSGVDIHEQRGNAIKFLLDILNEIPSTHYELSEFRGGKAHNIIPRDAFALISLLDSIDLSEITERVKKRWLQFLPKEDRSFFAEIENLEIAELNVVDQNTKKQILNFLNLFPHGAHSYDLESQKELVALSNNLAIVLLVRGEFYTQTSLRFFDRGECYSLEKKIVSLGETFDLVVTKNGEYPSWKPVRDNKLLDQVSKIYENLYEVKPKITAIHAGLECGILRDKIGPIDVVSFGPTIMGAHSPQERLLIPTVEKFWNLLLSVLKEI
jgi:dipeptidase D